MRLERLHQPEPGAPREPGDPEELGHRPVAGVHGPKDLDAAVEDADTRRERRVDVVSAPWYGHPSIWYHVPSFGTTVSEPPTARGWRR